MLTTFSMRKVQQKTREVVLKFSYLIDIARATLRRIRVRSNTVVSIRHVALIGK